MLIYKFLSIKLCKGGKFIINTAKRFCLDSSNWSQFNIFFWLLVESSFFLHTPSMWEPSLVFETVVLLCRYSRSSISSSQILGGNLFLKKLSKHLRIWSDKWINRLHDANKPFAKDINIKAVSRSPWLPWALWNMHFSSVQSCCEHTF